VLNLLPIGLARFKKILYDKHGRRGSKYKFYTSVEVKKEIIRGIYYSDHSAVCKHEIEKIYTRISRNNVVSHISLLKIVYFFPLATTRA